MNRIKVIIFVFIALLAFSPDQFAQQGDQGSPIILSNPSFEDVPHIGKQGMRGPRGWNDCGKPGETAPDVQPSPLKDLPFFDVTLEAYHGATYVGMVVRDNDTYEAISQRLRKPMEGGTCYNFSLSLAHSDVYTSISRKTDKAVGYVEGAVIRIWGGSGKCSKLEMLDESPKITNTEWMDYNFRLEPARNYSYILIEAFWKTPVMFAYNGNVLVDNASAIQPVPCEEAPLASIVEPPKKEVEPKKDSVKKPKEAKSKKEEQPIGVVEVEPAPKTPKKKELLKELNDDVIVGQEIKLDKLFFKADSSTLRNQDLPLLDEIYDFLIENKKVVVEIGGHTNNKPSHAFCNQLSTERAQSVANYLIGKGIDQQRVTYKGYGKTKPKYPNNTPTNRRKNQRVELKIISKG